MTSRESPSSLSLPPPPPVRWTLAPTPAAGAVSTLAGALDLPERLCAVLWARGFTEPGAARRFLRPGPGDLHSPELLAGAAAAARRIDRAIEDHEMILVHGDYDVDGIAGTALLTRWLTRLGGHIVPFVPHRIRDGYDLSHGGLKRAREKGVTLIVTVDCGIRAHEAVIRARREGIDVVVTDHHGPGETLPPAHAVVNPNRSDCPYPNKGLSGTGVAFKVCELLASERGMPTGEVRGYLDLVALATVADLVPLEGENRALTRMGLSLFDRTANVGLRTLLSRTGLRGKTIEAGHIGFVLAPRINAAGRIGDPTVPLRLLLTEDAGEAHRIVGQLERRNEERREEDRRILDEALALLATRFEPERDYGIVLADEGWHPGVMGIVASRLVERVHRPVILVALDGERGRGSGRSIPAFPIDEALERCSGHLIRFGGHRYAAGMDIDKKEVKRFREAFRAEARRCLRGKAGALSPSRTADAELPLAEATAKLAHELRELGPFGIGNPRPLFLARNLDLAAEPLVVGGHHLKLRLRREGADLPAIGFGMAPSGSVSLLPEGPIDAVFHFELNEFRGRSTPQARLVDLRPGGTLP